ncbi:23500_t:CDS:10 [Dentiscutata erythropus]|uniref:23500_t:CDS:1 n=1 Tax=Dentiscutata erythropus TaxID=1348616 RepID=A0A9N8VJ37_9GLOM|nr:23500_t:CDS:10 [Dentiscutata erythropus]
MSSSSTLAKRPPSPTDKEDVKKKKNIDAQYALELKLSEHPERPSIGSSGRKVSVKTNYLRVRTLPSGSLLHYSFVVVPDVKPPLMTKIFSQLASQGSFGNTCPVFDGNSAIYTCTPLPIGDEKDTSNIQTFLVTIRKVENIEMERLMEYLKEKCLMTSQIPTCITILNTVLNYGPRKSYAVVKQGIFPSDPNKRPIVLAGGIELKIGFCQSMRPGWDNMLVNVDICAGLFYPAVSLIEFCRQTLNKNNVNDLRRGVNDYEMRDLERALKGIKIRVTHRGDRKLVIKVERLSSKAADDLYFKNEKEGRDMSVSEYFEKNYNRRLEFKSLPCIMDKKKNYIPLEVCEILNSQRYEKSLSDKTKADMIRKTAMPPQDRFHKIEEGINHIFNYKNDENLKDFGIEVDPKMMVIEVLDTPKVKYARDEFVPQNGRWNLINKIFVRTRTLVNWSILVLDQRANNQVKNFAREFKTTLIERGMEMGIAYAKARLDRNQQVQIIIIIIPKKSSDIYGKIKRISDTELGIPTQCILSERLRKPNNKACWNNIALKVNAKLGGRNSILVEGQLDYVTNVKIPTMIMGADISHPGPSQSMQPSIAAVCASIDVNGTTYCGQVSVNEERRNETIEKLEEMATELLQIFSHKNGCLPHRMIFYRDGVSEGQFSGVVKKEVIALKKAFEKLYEQGKSPQLTFIVAQKRHHTRNDADQKGNCRPGTVVDQEIVQKNHFDFFLQSHSGIQVPPIAYAHLLAARVRMYPQVMDANTVSGFQGRGSYGRNNSRRRDDTTEDASDSEQKTAESGHSEGSSNGVTLPEIQAVLKSAMYFV